MKTAFVNGQLDRHASKVKGELDLLKELLADDEEVVALARAELDVKPSSTKGLLAATSSRLVFLSDQRDKLSRHDFPFGAIEGIDAFTGLIAGEVRVRHAGVVSVFKEIEPRARAAEIARHVLPRIGPTST